MAISPELSFIGTIAGAFIGATLVHRYTTARENKQKLEREGKIAHQMLIRVGWVAALGQVLPLYIKTFVPDNFIEELKAKSTSEFDVWHLASCFFAEYISEIAETTAIELEKFSHKSVIDAILDRIKSSKIQMADVMSITSFPKRMALINDKYNSYLDDGILSISAFVALAESGKRKDISAKNLLDGLRLWQDIVTTSNQYLAEILRSALVTQAEHDYILSYHKNEILTRLMRQMKDKESLTKASEAAQELARLVKQDNPGQVEPVDKA